MRSGPDPVPPPGPDIEVLTRAECWTKLRQAKFGRLATAADDGPQIYPVNHLVDHGTLVFRTDGGGKLRAAKGKRVAFEVDGVDRVHPADHPADHPDGGTDGTTVAWSVVVRGRVQEIYDIDEVMDVLGSPLVPWQLGAKARLMRLDPSEVSGRRFALRAGASAD